MEFFNSLPAMHMIFPDQCSRDVFTRRAGHLSALSSFFSYRYRQGTGTYLF